MTPQGLERATYGFRIGYWNAFRCQGRLSLAKFTRENDNGTFYAHDYIEGWECFLNEQYWDAQRENTAVDIIRDWKKETGRG